MKSENILALTPVLIPTPKSKIYFNETHGVITTEKFEGVFLKRTSISRLHLISKRAVKDGDWCMFYNQPSKVLEINGLYAKIETVTITSKDDAELINKIKGKIVIKEGDSGKMIHSFSIAKLQKIELTNDPELIKDGVPTIPEIGIKTLFDGNKEIEVNIIEEFVKRYNRNNYFNADKLSDELYEWSDPHIEGDITRIDCRLLVEWFKVKLELDIIPQKYEMELLCELHPRPITCGHNEIGEEGKDWQWSVEAYQGNATIYFNK